MKFTLRWQILLAGLAFLMVLALLSFQVQSAALCTTRVPSAGGVFTEGMVGAPQYLNPLLNDANPVDRQISNLLFDGLTRYDRDGRLLPALAKSWSVSEDGRTIQFILQDDIVWQDGEPVTTADVAYTYGLMQADDFPGSPALKTLWQSITITPIDDTTIEFTLQEPYAPFLDATTRGILPAHLLTGVTAAELPTHPFNQAPVGTGPWQVIPDQSWAETRRLQLQPNPLAWREGTEIPILEYRFYPDEQALQTAVETGELQAANSLSPNLTSTLLTLPATRLFTVEQPRYAALLFNLRETGHEAIRPLEIRQALAYGLNRQQLVDDTLNGQGLVMDGPYLPTSWAYNADALTHYNYDPITATARLDGQGWTLTEGQPIRQKEGQPLTLRLITLQREPFTTLAQALADQWAQLGIETAITEAPDVAALRELLAAGEFDLALVDITPPGDPDLYDFWSQEAIIRGQNYSGWNNRRASEALEAARQLWSVDERRPYYDSFLRLYSNELPALSLFQYVTSYGLSEAVNLADIGYISQPRDRYTTFADWFLLYRDITVSCPVEATPLDS